MQHEIKKAAERAYNTFYAVDLDKHHSALDGSSNKDLWIHIISEAWKDGYKFAIKQNTNAN